MKSTTVNTDQRLYLVKYKWTMSRGQFITDNVADCLKSNEANDKGIEFIKTFDPVNSKFVRISKADILRFHSWDTEAHLYLTNHYYFK